METNSSQLVNTELPVQDYSNEELLKTASWFCGITYAVLFGGGLAFQCIVNYQN